MKSDTYTEGPGVPANPPAFPFVEPPTECNVNTGMTLRDYFATKAAADEISSISYHHLSVTAQEEITGLKYPRREDGPGLHIERAKFHMAVTAALRFMFADAMLAARGTGGTR